MYFKAQDWDESWIDTTYTIVCEEYDRSYNLMCSDLGPDDDDGDHDSDHDYVTVGSVSFLIFFFHQQTLDATIVLHSTTIVLECL